MGSLQGGSKIASGQAHSYFSDKRVQDAEYKSGLRAGAPIEIRVAMKESVQNAAVYIRIASDGILTKDISEPDLIISIEGTENKTMLYQRQDPGQATAKRSGADRTVGQIAQKIEGKELRKLGVKYDFKGGFLRQLTRDQLAGLGITDSQDRGSASAEADLIKRGKDRLKRAKDKGYTSILDHFVMDSVFAESALGKVPEQKKEARQNERQIRLRKINRLRQNVEPSSNQIWIPWDAISICPASHLDFSPRAQFFVRKTQCDVATIDVVRLRMVFFQCEIQPCKQNGAPIFGCCLRWLVSIGVWHTSYWRHVGM
eukprot:s180_g12.t1